MLHDVVDTPETRSRDELLAAHAAQLAEFVETAGVERVADATGLPDEAVEALAAADVETAAALPVETAATILALDAGRPSGAEIAAAARDELLLGMTAGVLNVDVVAGEVAVDIEPREVQGMVEGRHPMTLRQYVALQQVIASREP